MKMRQKKGASQKPASDEPVSSQAQGQSATDVALTTSRPLHRWLLPFYR
jgi:hypothetical protein